MNKIILYSKDNTKHIFFKNRLNKYIHIHKISPKKSIQTEITKRDWDNVLQFVEENKFDPTDEDLAAMYNAWLSSKEFLPLLN